METDAVRAQLAATIVALRAELDQANADRDAWMAVATKYKHAAEEGIQAAAAQAAQQIDEALQLRRELFEGRGRD